MRIHRICKTHALSAALQWCRGHGSHQFLVAFATAAVLAACKSVSCMCHIPCACTRFFGNLGIIYVRASCVLLNCGARPNCFARWPKLHACVVTLRRQPGLNRWSASNMLVMSHLANTARVLHHNVNRCGSRRQRGVADARRAAYCLAGSAKSAASPCAPGQRCVTVFRRV